MNTAGSSTAGSLGIRATRNNPKYDLFDRLIKISAMYTSDIKYDAAAAEAYSQSDYVDAWGALTDI